MKSSLLQFWSIVRLGRPQFLPGGVAPFVLGSAVAKAEVPAVSWNALFLGQLVVSSVQLMTHYSNDYYDFEADRANRTRSAWSGGSRILQQGLLPRRTALHCALFWLIVALCGIVTLHAQVTSWLATALAVGMVMLSWGYSAPPLRLHSHGLGELAATVVVALFVPCFAYAVQTGRVSRLVLLAALPVAFLQFAMLVAVSIPDRRADQIAEKGTLAARCSVPCVGALLSASLLAAYAIIPILHRYGLPIEAAVALASTAPLAGVQLATIWRGAVAARRLWPRLTLLAVALVFVGAVAETVGFVASKPRARDGALGQLVVPRGIMRPHDPTVLRLWLGKLHFPRKDRMASFLLDLPSSSKFTIATGSIPSKLRSSSHELFR